MLINYIKTAFRNIIKTRMFSFVNILGLSIGMAACLLILHYVNYQKSYDRFHPNSERIYRLRYERTNAEGTVARFASCSPPTAEFLRDRYPELEKIARIFRFPAVVSFGERKFTEDNMYFAEYDFLDMFKCNFIRGNPVEGFKKDGNAVISQSVARKYFGDQDPIGKTFSVDKKKDFQVAAVFEDLPSNTHLKFDILLSFESIHRWYKKEVLQSWGHTGFYTYLRLKEGTDRLEFQQKLADLMEKEFGELQRKYKVWISLKVQPVLDIHLNSNYMQEYEANGDRDSVNFLFIIALFIIMMAWVNYINLSTARSLTRAREVGLRKVVGASRQQLSMQFFFEILMINIAAIAMAFLAVKLALPFFALITGTPMSYSIWSAGWFWLAVVFMLIVGVFLSGLYPVTVLTSFRPTAVLKGKLGSSARGMNLRKALVVFQFIMSFILIAGTVTVYLQLEYMKDQDLGFNKKNVLVVKAPRVRNETFKNSFQTFKEELLKQTGISNFCVTTSVPGRQVWWDAGAIRKAGDDDTKNKNYQIVGIDYDFIDLFQLKLAGGRNFAKEYPGDIENSLIINETAARWLGFESNQAAVNGQVIYWGKTYTVVGVLKDYHQQSPKSEFEPTIFRPVLHGRGLRGQFAIKLEPHDISSSVEVVKNFYQQFFPGNPFDYFFLEDYYNQQYKEEELFGKVFGVFSFLAIFVTSLGIFGLSSFMAVNRTREVGIRKVMGANVPQILVLLAKDFMVLLGMAFVVSLPLGYMSVKNWLAGFAYRMDLSLWLVIVPLMVVSLITMVTISAHVIRASLANPVDSIRYE